MTHEAYERIRDRPADHDEERPRARAISSVRVSSYIKVPDGAADIPDFKKKGF